MRNYERAKASRRTKIVAAARELIGETGDLGFSMRALAERSGLSLATPYNLFGSKGDIIVQLYSDDLAQFERRVARLKPAGALDRVFDIVALSARVYAADERFYRTIMGAVQTLPDARLNGRIQAPRQAFWEGVIGAAIAGGDLRKETNARLVTAMLIHIARSVLGAWAADDISLAQLEAEMGYGFALILLPSATRAAAVILRARLAVLEAQLAEPMPAPAKRKARAVPEPA